MKTKGFTRFISMFLAVMLVVSALPMSFAADGDEPVKAPVKKEMTVIKDGAAVGIASALNGVFGADTEKVEIPALSSGLSLYKDGAQVNGAVSADKADLSKYSIEASLSATIPVTIILTGKDKDGKETIKCELTVKEKAHVVIVEGAIRPLTSIAFNKMNIPTTLSYVVVSKPAAGLSITNATGQAFAESSLRMDIGSLDAYKLTASNTFSAKQTILVRGYDKNDKCVDVYEIKAGPAVVTVADFTVPFIGTEPVSVDRALFENVIKDYFGATANLSEINGISFTGNGGFFYGNGIAIGANTTVSGVNLDTIKFQSLDGKNTSVTYSAKAKIGTATVAVTGTINFDSNVAVGAAISYNVARTDKTLSVPANSFLIACGVTGSSNKLTLTYDTAKISGISITSTFGDTTTITAITSGKEINLVDDGVIDITFAGGRLSAETAVDYVLKTASETYIGKLNITVSGGSVNPSDPSNKIVEKELVCNISAATKSASFDLKSISELCEGKTIEIISFPYTTSSVSAIKLGAEELKFGTEYVVAPYATFTANLNKIDSDITLAYLATAEDGTNYIGTIVFTRANSITIPEMSAYSVYSATASYRGYIDASKITAKEALSTFKIIKAEFTYKTTDTTTKKEVSKTETIFSGTAWAASSTLAKYGFATTAEKGTAGVASFTNKDKLYYVPGTVEGTALITYESYVGGNVYIGTISYKVYNLSALDVTLNLKSRDAYALSTADTQKVVFTDVIKNAITSSFGSGATLGYITFGAPSTASKTYGTLYSDSKLTALTSSTSSGYYFSAPITGAATLPVSDLYYVPSTTSGTYQIGYTVYVTFNNLLYSFDGILKIVTPADKKIDPDVFYQTTANKRVYFNVDEFEACVKDIRSTALFESFKLTGVPSVGTLYYSSTKLTTSNIADYELYESATGGRKVVGNISYVPTGSNYYEIIPFTVTYKETSTSAVTKTYNGNILINVTSGEVKDINYTVQGGSTVYLDVSAFTEVCKQATGANLSHVYFNTASAKGGKLYYNNTLTTANALTAFYTTSSGTYLLSKVLFKPSVTTGTATFTYTAYSEGGMFLYEGKVNVNLYSVTKTPNHKKCVASAQKMTCNGQSVSLQAYNIDDYNYIKLRDIAALMAGTGSKFSIRTTSNNEVYCELGGSYTKVADDLKKGTDQSKTCVASSWAFYVDGVYKSVYVYNIGGYNYFKLRDLGDALKFTVDFDSKTNTAIIASSDYRG